LHSIFGSTNAAVSAATIYVVAAVVLDLTVGIDRLAVTRN
jgi:hypothetical protein